MEIEQSAEGNARTVSDGHRRGLWSEHAGWYLCQCVVRLADDQHHRPRRTDGAGPLPHSARHAGGMDSGSSSGHPGIGQYVAGLPGTGKSHLAVALGIAAVKARKSVYRTTLAELVEALAKARREDRLAEKIRFFTRTSLLIVDEIGYVTIDGGGANLFFQLVNARYEKGAMILTSNRGFAEWGELFGDPVVATALLDRLLHHAVVIHIEGASYRLREHHRPDPRARPRQRAHRAAASPRTPWPTAPEKGAQHRCPTLNRTSKLGNSTSALLGIFQSALTPA